MEDDELCLAVASSLTVFNGSEESPSHSSQSKRTAKFGELSNNLSRSLHVYTVRVGCSDHALVLR